MQHLNLATAKMENQQLKDVLDTLLEPKALSAAKREQQLTLLNSILQTFYVPETLDPSVGPIQTLLQRLLRTSTSPNTQAQAAKALALTVITCPDNAPLEEIRKTLRQTIMDTTEDYIAAKAAAIYAMASTYIFSADEYDIQDQMSFLLSIVESDGHVATAPDSEEVVSAALEAWSFLCTYLEDAQEVTEDAMESLEEQLDSSSVSVNVAAGEAIALLFEKSYTPAEADEVRDRHLAGVQMVQRYQPTRNTDKLKSTLSELSSGSKKHLKREDRKTQRGAFVDILNSVENPLAGPRFRESLQTKSGSGRTNKSWLRGGEGGMLRLDKWWKLLRVQFSRRVLEGGFNVHWMENFNFAEATELQAEWEEE